MRACWVPLAVLLHQVPLPFHCPLPKADAGQFCCLAFLSSLPQEAKSLAKQQRHLQMEAEAARLEHREEHVSPPAPLPACLPACLPAVLRFCCSFAALLSPFAGRLPSSCVACNRFQRASVLPHPPPPAALLQKMRVDVEQQLQLTQEQVMMLTNELNEAQVGAWLPSI